MEQHAEIDFSDRDTLNNFAKMISTHLNNDVFRYIYNAVEVDPKIRQHLHPAFPFPMKLRLGILKDYFAIEFVGSEVEEDEGFVTEAFFKPQWTIFDFLDIEFPEDTRKLPWVLPIENASFHNGNSLSVLCEYFYDFLQSKTDIIMNMEPQLPEIYDYSYISNTTFFWTDESENLKIRYISFLLLFPIKNNAFKLYDLTPTRELILNYQISTYNVEAHKVLNEFIELICLDETDEPIITKFLEINPIILQLAFSVNEPNPQILLEWQYETDKKNLQPDFLSSKMDGYSDIYEFKLPNLKSAPIVGTPSRRHPSFEIDQAIAQVNQYEEWFQQELNRNWLEKTHNIKILNPNKNIVIGRRNDFTPEDRRRLREDRNVTIWTYDEFIELVRYQIYRVR